MRSFKIDSIHKIAGGVIRYNGGRFISETAAGAAKKMFTKALQHTRTVGPLSLNITMTETTQDSLHKTYIYRVTKKNHHNVVVRDGVEIEYHYTTTAKRIG